MPRSQPDTDQLLDRAEQGDPSAAGQLLVRHQHRLRKMVSLHLDARLARRVDPSDVVQETLAEAAQKLPDYLADRPIAFYPWLRAIAWERLIDVYRRHLHAEGRTVLREEYGSASFSSQSANQLAKRLADGQSSPSARFAKAEIHRRVRASLDELDGADRELLIMRYLEQLRVREISQVVGVSEAAVKSRLRKALERLQHNLGDGFSGST